MAVPGETRLDPAVLADAEAVQGGGDGAIGQVRAPRAHARLELASSVRWSRRGGVSAARHASQSGNQSASSMMPPSTQTMPRTARGMAPAQLEHDVAAPRLADEDGPREPERLDQRPEIARPPMSMP